MAMSSAPSSKRRRLWTEIFDNVNITDKQLKEYVVPKFTNSLL